MSYDNLAIELGSPPPLLGIPLLVSDPPRLRQVRSMLAASPTHHQAVQHLALIAARLTGAAAAGIVIIGERELFHRARVGADGPVGGHLEELALAPVFATGRSVWVEDVYHLFGVDCALVVPVCTQAGQVALLWATVEPGDDAVKDALAEVAQLVAREVQHATASHLGGVLLDERTGLYNLRGFDVLAEQMLQFGRRQGDAAAVMLVSLEGARHSDDLVLEFARVLRATFRSSDVIARLQGAEYAVLVTGCSPEASHAVVRRLRAKMVAERDGRWSRVHLVAGVAPDDGSSSLEDLLAEAVSNTFSERPLRLLE